MDTNEFAALFTNFMATMSKTAAAAEPSAHFRVLLNEHFKAHGDVRTIPMVGERFDLYERPNLQLALEELRREALAAERPFAFHGVIPARYERATLATLTAEQDGYYASRPGPLQFDALPVSTDQRMECIKAALITMQTATGPLAVFIPGPDDYSRKGGVTVEVMAPLAASAAALIADLRNRMHRLSVYRGKVVSLHSDGNDPVVQFHDLPQPNRRDVILAEETLARIERQTVGFSRHAARVRAAGHNVKRGVLLYGPPGTGKTFTAMHLAASMPERTVVLATGRGLGSLETACAFARYHAPATIIVEDVDLIAENRFENHCAKPLLFELLNIMDGLSSDCDLLFLLTTNHPESLEPALIARPGRIDQAIEVPLPDDDCRRRLFAHYSGNVRMAIADPEQYVARTAGFSAAFIKELIRRAMLLACSEHADASVNASHLDTALGELQLVRSLLKTGDS